MAHPGGSNNAAPVERGFTGYLRSLGPGLIVVLTWLGAGDIVETGVAGGNYGYSLIWVIVIAVLMRFVFVSLIAKYHLLNERGESVLDGLGRLHPLYPLFLAVVAIIMGHFYGSYMTVGIGESFANLTGVGETWHWALVWNGVALAIVFRPVYGRVEVVFKVLLAILTVSILGTAVWVGPDPAGIAKGLVSFTFPEQVGRFSPVLIAVGVIGAVGGSLMNLVYPYFLDQKGWRGPRYRRVQQYDFLLAIVIMIILDIALWTLGAELLYPEKKTIVDTTSLAELLGAALGEAGRVLFYLGIFAAVFTSLVGHALGLACLGSHGILRWRAGPDKPVDNYRDHVIYRWIAVWCLVSPLVWTVPVEDKPGFVTLTLVANSAQVVLIPFLAGGIWWITASARFIGTKHRNRWWENAFMALLFALAIWGAINGALEVVEELKKW